MKHFPHNPLDSAPEASKPAMRDLQSAFGMVPNVAGTMATSPVLINSLVGLFGRVHGGSFTEAQIQVLLLTNAVTNAADWAVAFHSALALKQDVAAADVDAIRAGRSPKDSKLGALSSLARSLIETRGRIDDQVAEQFLAAGFGTDHLLEVIAVVAASTITNYTANVTQPPLEAQFQAQTWPRGLFLGAKAASLRDPLHGQVADSDNRRSAIDARDPGLPPISRRSPNAL
jgi:alkylhydroperoxidase family enzyme